MKRRGIPSRFESDSVPADDLFSHVRASIAATPASTVNTGVRVAIALTLVPLLTGAVVVIGSDLMDRSPASGLIHGLQSPGGLAVLLMLVAGLTVVATAVATRRGPEGFGAGVLPLTALAVLAPPV